MFNLDTFLFRNTTNDDQIKLQDLIPETLLKLRSFPGIIITCFDYSAKIFFL